MTKENLQLPAEGIYFNMPSADYFALPYFSRTAAELVRFSGREFENYIENPTQETPAMALGTAIHSMFLEPEAFEKNYVKSLSPLDFPDKKIIQTVEDLKPYLEAFGLKKSGKKEELLESVRGYLDPAEVVIWDDVKAAFERENQLFGRKVLSDDDFKTLQGMRGALNQSQDLPETIKNGRPEVVIIWKDRETGIMCKCRLDYVQPLAVTDIKSFSIKNFKVPLLQQLEKKTVFENYNLQWAIYKEALETVIEAVNAGKAQVHGENDQAWLAEFLRNPIKQFFILYVRTQAPYQMQAVELLPAEIEGAGSNTYFAVAHKMWRNSINKYHHFLITGKWLGESEIVQLRDQRVPNAMWQDSSEENASEV